MEWLFVGAFIAVGIVGYWYSSQGHKPTAHTPPDAPMVNAPPKRTPTGTDWQRIAREIIAAEKAGGSHWDEGAAIAESYGVTIWDAHDHYIAELDRIEAAEERERTRTKKVIATEPDNPVDLRTPEGVRVSIVGTSHWVEKEIADSFSGTEFYLRREPGNKHDANAIAVYGGNRKFGYISRAGAEKYAALFDSLGGTFVVTRDLSRDYLCFFMPRLPQLRKLCVSVR